MSEAEPTQRHYFVDEAGDPVLFDARGNAMPGQVGCSRHFILGVLDVPDPVSLAAELEALRAQLLADPYFHGVPSMQPERRKTAWAFHVKDDLPEVRREVFRVLITHKVRFFAVVRDKARVLTMCASATATMWLTGTARTSCTTRWFRGFSRTGCT